jgi:hypothetical protein
MKAATNKMQAQTSACNLSWLLTFIFRVGQDRVECLSLTSAQSVQSPTGPSVQIDTIPSTTARKSSSLLNVPILHPDFASTCSQCHSFFGRLALLLRYCH